MKHYTVEDDKLMAICKVCSKTEKSGDLKLASWQMQHFHFSDGEHEVLTCEKCKNLSPEFILRKYLKTLSNDVSEH